MDIIKKKGSNKDELTWVSEVSPTMQIHIVDLQIEEDNVLALLRDKIVDGATEAQTKNSYIYNKEWYNKAVNKINTTMSNNEIQEEIKHKAFVGMKLSHLNKNKVVFSPDIDRPDAYYIDDDKKQIIGYEEFKLTAGVESKKGGSKELSSKAMAVKKILSNDSIPNDVKNNIISWLNQVNIEGELSLGEKYKVNSKNLSESLNQHLSNHMDKLEEYVSELKSLKEENYDVHLVFVIDMSNTIISTIIKNLNTLKTPYAFNWLSIDFMRNFCIDNYKIIHEALSSLVDKSNLKLMFIIPCVRYIFPIDNVDIWSLNKYQLVYIDNVSALDNHVNTDNILYNNVFYSEDMIENKVDNITSINSVIHEFNTKISKPQIVSTDFIGGGINNSDLFMTIRE